MFEMDVLFFNSAGGRRLAPNGADKAGRRERNAGANGNARLSQASCGPVIAHIEKMKVSSRRQEMAGARNAALAEDDQRSRLIIG